MYQLHLCLDYNQTHVVQCALRPGLVHRIRYGTGLLDVAGFLKKSLCRLKGPRLTIKGWEGPFEYHRNIKGFHSSLYSACHKGLVEVQVNLVMDYWGNGCQRSSKQKQIVWIVCHVIIMSADSHKSRVLVCLGWRIGDNDAAKGTVMFREWDRV